MLAPWFYRHVVNPTVGPIVRLSVRALSNRSNGHRFEALAYLHPSLRTRTAEQRTAQIYGDADGTGSDVRRSTACHKAISEALERWAFYDLCGRTDDHKNFGLDVDRSSTGFAAWPGVFRSEARKRARLEAIERWAIAGWWSEQIGHRKIATPSWNGIELLTPFTDAFTVILFGNAHGSNVYGFAAGRNQTEAIARAETELNRNMDVLRDDRGQISPRAPLFEQRLQFFAGEYGRTIFAARLAKNIENQTEMPKNIVDQEIIGPWTTYAVVWRVLFEPIFSEEKDEVHFFLF